MLPIHISHLLNEAIWADIIQELLFNKVQAGDSAVTVTAIEGYKLFISSLFLMHSWNKAIYKERGLLHAKTHKNRWLQ